MNQKQKNIIERKTKDSIRTENKKTHKTAGSILLIFSHRRHIVL